LPDPATASMSSGLLGGLVLLLRTCQKDSGNGNTATEAL